jgi:hypothetical protein
MNKDNIHIHKLERRDLIRILDRFANVVGVEDKDRTERNIIIAVDRCFKEWLEDRSERA